MLSIRHKTLLRFILEHPEGITGKQLSGRLRVSGKTVRNDVAAINGRLREKGLHISASQKQGYYIEENEREPIQRILKEQQLLLSSREAQTPEERRFAILDKALGHPGMGIEKIAEHLCVSEQTIYKDIACLEKKLNKVCGFSGLAVQNHKIYLHETEEEIRRLVFRLICACVFHSGQLMDGNLHQLMNGIVNLHEIFTFYEYAENYARDREMKVPRQVLFLGAWMVFYVNVRREEAYFLENREETCHEDELWDFLGYMNRSLFLEFEACDMEFLHKALGSVGFCAGNDGDMEKARDIFRRLSRELKSQYGLVFLERMQEPFAGELCRILRRLRTGYQFCDWHPCDRESVGRFFYEASIMAAHLIWQQTGVYLSLTEVCRMGEYIRACTEREKDKIRIQMVYDGDMGWYYMVRRWMEDRLGDETEICGACPGYLAERECIRNKPDFIMGERPSGIFEGVPSMGMPELLNPEEEGRIRKMLEKTIKKERSLSFTRQMISESRVAFLDSGASFEKLVQACVEILEKEGCILPGQGFFQELADRERQYPCSIEGGCWLLQPFSRQAVSEGIAAAVEQSPGGTGKVVLVCAFPAASEKQFGGMIADELERLLSSRDIAAKLKRAKDKTEMVSLIAGANSRIAWRWKGE